MGGSYILDLGVLTFLFISQAIAWNVLGGYAGQISFSYAPSSASARTAPVCCGCMAGSRC